MWCACGRDGSSARRHWLLGYPYAIGLMVLITVVGYRFFKRKGWL